ncbi:MAG TPA: alpha/beta hydrolase [Acidimicrobiales bacterium]|nr:alpha/beta hydrolase [Acidimicrobiales bacterium]
MPATAFFTDAHGVDVAYYRWMPAGEPKAVVLIAHGASEHGARYDRFATFLAEHGYAVFAQDHRGHGNTAKTTGIGIAGPGDWDAILDDQHELVQLARAAVPGVKVVLFAHSMGSFIAQGYIQKYGDEIDGLVLSGSAGSMGDVKGTLELLDAIIPDAGADSPAPTFATFNEQFAPVRTDFDWLSRDPDEVDKYIADPFCGDDMPLSLGFARGMLACLHNAWQNEASLRKDLPVLFITGEMDPVSENASTVRLLEQRYRDHGMQDVTALYYPEARHELLNEINRDEVQAAVLAWIERVVA